MAFSLFILWTSTELTKKDVLAPGLQRREKEHGIAEKHTNRPRVLHGRRVSKNMLTTRETEKTRSKTYNFVTIKSFLCFWEMRRVCEYALTENHKHVIYTLNYVVVLLLFCF